MSYKFSSIEGNKQKLDGGSMFGNAPRAVWERWYPVDPIHRIDLSCRALLIEKGDKKILCETGIGAFFEPKLADRFGVQEPDRHILLDSLKDLGVEEDEIDYVILSHLHFDHAGGLMPSYKEQQAGRKELHFPKAQYLVGHGAWQRCLKPHERDRASFIPGLSDALKASGRLVIMDEGQSKFDELPDLEFLYTFGHTPGHMHTLVHTDNGKVFFCGDLIPGTAWLHIPITMGYDRFPEHLIDEKKAIYERAIQESWWMFFTHDPFVVASRAQKNAKGKVESTEAQKDWKHWQVS